MTRLNAFVPNFPHLIPLILFFSQLSLLRVYLISIQSQFRTFVISFALLKTNNVNLTQFLLSIRNSVLTNLALLSSISEFFLYLKASFHLHSNKQSFILYSKNLLFLIMISTTFVLFLILTLSPKFSRKLLPLVSSLTYCLTLYLLHSDLPIACSIPLKPHFSVFTMTSS